MIEVHCATCGKTFLTYPCRANHPQYCSKQCLSTGVSKNTRPSKIGSRNPAWKGGNYYTDKGYIMLTVSALSDADKELIRPMVWRWANRPVILEHRFLMAKALGRPLEKYEIVHHLNGIRDDNRLENLELITTRGGHYSKHPFVVCPKCGHHFPVILKNGQYSF